MKAMTCKQLGEACDEAFIANSFAELKGAEPFIYFSSRSFYV